MPQPRRFLSALSPAIACATVAAALSLPLAARADLAYGFDTDAQGLTATNGGNLVHQAAGGNPGGFLQITDVSDDDMLLHLPVGALGNWSGYLGGSFSFDARDLNGESPDWSPFGELTLVGTAGSLVLDIAPAGQPANDGAWHRYTTTFNTATWGGNLPAVLGNITDVTLKVEFHAGVTEVVGIDNVAVAAVPEAGAAWAMLAGLGLLGVVARSRRG